MCESTACNSYDLFAAKLKRKLQHFDMAVTAVSSDNTHIVSRNIFKTARDLLAADTAACSYTNALKCFFETIVAHKINAFHQRDLHYTHYEY